MMKASFGGLALSTALAAQAAPPTHPALREALLRMTAEDQQVRGKDGPVDPEGMARVDAINTARLKEIVAQVGWPTKTMVDRDGAQAAWLLAQHADRDPAFQQDVLARMEKLLDSGEANRGHYAYLWDRTHTPQRYGTQGMCVEKGRWAAREIEDAANVDARRAQVGLPPMAEYEKMVATLCDDVPAPVPAKKGG
jgi:hypothetical protein